MRIEQGLVELAWHETKFLRGCPIFPNSPTYPSIFVFGQRQIRVNPEWIYLTNRARVVLERDEIMTVDRLSIAGIAHS